MAEPSQSTSAFLLERFYFIFETLSIAETSYFEQLLHAVAGVVSFTEEPNVGRSSRQGCNPTGESPVVSIARVGHVVMPHPGMGNHPGYAWCKRPGRPVDDCGGCDLEV